MGELGLISDQTNRPIINLVVANGVVTIDSAELIQALVQATLAALVVPANNVHQDATHRFVTDTEKTKWNKLEYGGTVATFDIALAAITAGKAKQFTITLNRLYGAATLSTYDGTNWFHSPALIQNT